MGGWEGDGGDGKYVLVFYAESTGTVTSRRCWCRKDVCVGWGGGRGAGVWWWMEEGGGICMSRKMRLCGGGWWFVGACLRLNFLVAVVNTLNIKTHSKKKKKKKKKKKGLNSVSKMQTLKSYVIANRG